MQQNKNNKNKNTRENFQKKLPFLLAKNKIINSIKQFFYNNNFIEVDTPILQYSPGMEVHLFAFETLFNNINGNDKQKLYLHTSPEFSMKKLLSFGMQNIFQFTHTFRNEIISKTHYPEFLMLEWYRTGENYTKLMEDCKIILQETLKSISKNHFEYNGKICNANKIQKITIQEAINKYCKFNILETIDNFEDPTPKLLIPYAKKLGINVSTTDTWDDIFNKLMFEFVETNLGINFPTILYEYPLHQAALSKTKEDDSRLAERFELYICGIEVANAFTELTDSKIQEKRFLHDQQEKQKIYKQTFPIDYEFLNSIENMKPCTGIALGVDRLCMLALNSNNITDMLWTEIPEI